MVEDSKNLGGLFVGAFVVVDVPALRRDSPASIALVVFGDVSPFVVLCVGGAIVDSVAADFD